MTFTPYELGRFALAFDLERFPWNNEKTGGGPAIAAWFEEQARPHLELADVDLGTVNRLRMIVLCHAAKYGKKVGHRPSSTGRAPGLQYVGSHPLTIAFGTMALLTLEIAEHRMGLGDLPTMYDGYRMQVSNGLRREHAPQQGPHVVGHRWRDDWAAILDYERPRGPAWMTESLPEVLQRLLDDDVVAEGVDPSGEEASVLARRMVDLEERVKRLETLL